jgi:DNA-directed RNA polymerase specialized sigma24 family protein
MARSARRPGPEREDGRVDLSPDAAKQRRYAASRRRAEAANLLRLVASMASYASAQVSDGLSPEPAREVVAEMAGELAAASASLRRLARLDPEDRQRLARLMAGNGVPVVEVARRLGCAERTVHRWLGRP